MKTKHVNLRLEQETYDFLLKKALQASKKENRIVKISEIIRNILETQK